MKNYCIFLFCISPLFTNAQTTLGLNVGINFPLEDFADNSIENPKSQLAKNGLSFQLDFHTFFYHINDFNFGVNVRLDNSINVYDQDVLNDNPDFGYTIEREPYLSHSLALGPSFSFRKEKYAINISPLFGSYVLHSIKYQVTDTTTDQRWDGTNSSEISFSYGGYVNVHRNLSEKLALVGSFGYMKTGNFKDVITVEEEDGTFDTEKIKFQRNAIDVLIGLAYNF